MAALIAVSWLTGSLLQAAELVGGNDAAASQIVVYKTPTCGCCSKWVEHLRAHGFDVEVRTVASTAAAQAEAGVPRAAGSCHTAVVDGYFIEGHVPADLVGKLLTERPEHVRGLAVPGMPAGSPGMESPRPVRYDVIAVGTDGGFYRYATRRGKPAR